MTIKLLKMQFWREKVKNLQSFMQHYSEHEYIKPQSHRAYDRTVKSLGLKKLTIAERLRQGFTTVAMR